MVQIHSPRPLLSVKSTTCWLIREYSGPSLHTRNRESASDLCLRGPAANEFAADSEQYSPSESGQQRSECNRYALPSARIAAVVSRTINSGDTAHSSG